MKQIFERLALCAVRENGRGARRFLSSTRGVKRGRRDWTQYFPIKLQKKLDFGATNVTHRGGEWPSGRKHGFVRFDLVCSSF